MSRIAYYRVSAGDQSVEAQRQALGGAFDREFEDVGISGAVKAESRPGFAQLLHYVREGDTICVYAIDRLGRDALDVQAMVRRLLDEGVTLDVRGLGVIGRGVGELIVAVLAQMADMERHRIRERCESGREAARAALAATGRTHKGKVSLGRPTGRRAGKEDVTPEQVAQWRRENAASIAATADHFNIGKATVTRYCAAAG
jgi:putative DNA-invertase from lambdoid prophage Rac